MADEQLVLNNDLAEKLYINALPLLVSEMVHRDYPADYIKHDRFYPTNETAKFGKPNRDTLYSAGFLQLADTPYLLEIPKIEDRYFLFPFFSAYGDVINSLGTKSGKFGKYFLIQNGKKKPDGYDDYETITFRESLIGYLMRIETKGEDDYKNVHNIQDSIKLTPLYKERLRKNEYKPENIDPVIYAKSLPDKEFYELYGRLLKDNPALDNQVYDILALLDYDADNGILNYDNLTDVQKNILNEGRKSGIEKLSLNDISNLKYKYDGKWLAILGGMGEYGNDYIGRARVMGSPGGWGANVPSECVYYNADTDNNKKILSTEKNYKIHFKKGGLPHAGAFWSLAVYGGDTGDVTDTENGIYSLNSNDLNLGILKTNPDGSLDIYIGPDKPDEYFINNWIESKYPNDNRISINIRVYIPDEITKEGLWETPDIIEI